LGDSGQTKLSRGDSGHTPLKISELSTEIQT
jgi:hypothetical protein